ncbi:DUF3083 family protein [Catenovulum sp. 2E275]|uniref:DUF3083 family protein n=1 Tax=Catenovulum sp. 2E275 TaxID=2980497 RepID=UPI0021D11F11|nr:DUF3083 family protein [Catenovulum sp. 2E275]MCU4674642.1 DUF3083 family protein [Catenovulum sp. 2E275]
MSIIRKRSAQHKLYIPANTRENQYLLAKFELTDELVKAFAGSENPENYKACYEGMAKVFFEICAEFGLESSQFVANDKFIRVRYSPERLTSQTDQQILFLYSPCYHFNSSSYFDETKRAKKIKLLFLANGRDIRSNSAHFHKKVEDAILKFAAQAKVNEGSIRICDHQHLTFDLFAKEKGHDGTQAHKLRSIRNRFKADNVEVPEIIDAQNYAVITMPITRRIREMADIDSTAEDLYNPLYTMISEAFINSAKEHNLSNGYMLANDLVPVVRSQDEESLSKDGELFRIGYNPKQEICGYNCKWSAKKLVDSVQFVFVAAEADMTNYGYGKHFNQILSAMRAMAAKLDYVYDTEAMSVRLHQHIGFYK